MSDNWAVLNEEIVSLRAEIDRLRAICKDYADVCACASKEIRRLKATIASMANEKEESGGSPNPCQPAQNPQ